MKDKREFRAGVPAEIRADDSGVTVTGYAAVFNQEADIGGWFRELIMPGAFKDAIRRDDVLFLVNHEGLPLARTKSGTLKLSEDDHGLLISAELDADDPDVRAITGKMKRGDLDKMSFGFIPTVQEWDDSEEPPLRTIKEAQLFDVSIVNKPAYDGTEIGLRCLEDHREQAKKELDDQRKKNFNATRKRLKMKGHLALKEREKG